MKACSKQRQSFARASASCEGMFSLNLNLGYVFEIRAMFCHADATGSWEWELEIRIAHAMLSGNLCCRYAKQTACSVS